MSVALQLVLGVGYLSSSSRFTGPCPPSPAPPRAQVNVDNNVVGWYKSTRARGGFCDLETVQTQYEYQSKLGANAVVLVYDPLLSSAGTLSLKVNCMGASRPMGLMGGGD